MVICGPKASTFGLVLSIWGILQLAVTGLLFYYKSVAFIEDLKISESAFEKYSIQELRNEVDYKYQQVTMVVMLF